MSATLDTAARDRYERELAAAPARPEPPTTVSSVPIDALYTPDSVADLDPDADLGFPGQYPFTRGVHASMYRSRGSRRPAEDFCARTRSNARAWSSPYRCIRRATL